VNTFETYQARVLGSSWLHTPKAQKWLKDFGWGKDQVADRALLALRSRFTSLADAQGLALIGQDRGLPRWYPETTEQYRARLLASFGTWRKAGTKDGVLEALTNCGYTPSLVESTDPVRWSEFAVFLDTPTLPSETESAWDDGVTTWDAENTSWDNQLTGAKPAELISVINRFKSGESVLRGLYLRDPSNNLIRLDGDPAVTPTPETGLVFGRGSFGLVYTHNAAHTVNQATVDRVARVQASHIVGFGSGDPQPVEDGPYDWAAIDPYINRIRNATVPQIVLYGAPDWMREGGGTYSDHRVLTSKFAKFAELCKQVALRYTWCKCFTIWNEFKGFFDGTLNRWEYEDYTTMYNMVYTAIKSVRPDVLIGGPYMVLDKYTGSQSNPGTIFGDWGRVDQRVQDAYDYWRANAVGYDYVNFDFGPNNLDADSTHTDARCLDGAIAFMTWIRTWTDKPIGIQETYLDPNGGTTMQDTRNLWGSLLTRMRNEISGESFALIWDETGFRPFLDAPLVTVLDSL
jgi:Phage tail protein (Tail_P2_I)